MSIIITPQARERLTEVLSSPDNHGSKLRVVFEGFG
jgi:Fe-S cluster assembly iron-binding protein IscA